MKFTQLGCITLLDRIKVKLGDIGTVDFGRLILYAENANIVLMKMRPYLIEKKSQCDIVLQLR